MSTETNPDPAHPVTYSTIVATTRRGAHVLNVNAYAATKGLIPTGSPLSSASFTTGGQSSWHLAYYPNGDCPEQADYVSVFLVLDSAAPGAAVSADFTISLLDAAGEAVPSHSKSIHRHQFAAGGPSGSDTWWAGFSDFIRRETLEESDHLRGDCFFIRCDVVEHEIRTVRAQGRTVFSSSPWGRWCCDTRSPMSNEF